MRGGLRNVQINVIDRYEKKGAEHFGAPRAPGSLTGRMRSKRANGAFGERVGGPSRVMIEYSNEMKRLGEAEINAD